MVEEKGPVGRFIDAISSRFRTKTTPEPIMPLWKSGVQEPVLVQGVSIPALYATVQESIILRTTINTLCQEIFRRGFYWQKKFQMKCQSCQEEYKHEVKECDVCGGTEMDTPNPDQILYPKWFVKQRNSMDQSFMDVLRELEWDLDIVDDAFMVLIKDYYLEPDNNDISLYRVKEILRGDPTFIRIVSDKRGVRGGRYLVCPVHRDKTYPFGGDYKNCEVCNKALQDVHFINTAGSGKTQYYIEGEIIHFSKFNPSKLYGRSPVATLWRQAMTLSAMDNFMYLSYQKRRMPRGVLAITTDNIQSTASFWKGAEEKMERDPHYIPKVGIESATGRGRVEFVRFMDTLDEMQYGAVRDELRMRIAAFYGVSNVFMMDSGKGGGLNNEGMQILVTNRAVESGQKLWGRDVFPRLFSAMGVEDWEMTLYPNEEEDDVTRLRRDEMEVNIAQRMQQLGFQPQLTEDAGRDIRFFYKKPDEAEMAQQAQMQAMQGQPPPGGGPEGAPPPGGPMPGGPMGPGPMMVPPGGPGPLPQSMAPGAAPPGAPLPGGQQQPPLPPKNLPGTNIGLDRARINERLTGMTHRFGNRPVPTRKSEDVEKSQGMGSGSESVGIRRNTPKKIAPVKHETASDGAPVPKINANRKKTPIQEAHDAIQDAKDQAADPLGSKKKKSNFKQ
tara:strand:- start:2849 stop:4858 length:2010 start_codon:yes stop_codon:yes gene_type:complete